MPPFISLVNTKEKVILNGYAICNALGEKNDDISADMLKQMFSEGIFINNTEREEKRRAELQACFTQDVNAGDVLAFHYSPQQGVFLLLNDKVVMPWPYRKSFFNMILRMWIGDYPPTRRFKQRILDLQKADTASA